MRALIIDDEAPARDELAWLLEQCGEPVEIVGQASTAREALSMIEEDVTPELVFLDVDMPGIDGVRLAEILCDRADGGPLIVFVTAYQEYAADAFDVDAVDYLLKPIRTDRLQRALRRARERVADRARRALADAPSEATDSNGQRFLERISVEERGVYRVLPLDDVLFFEAEDGIVVAQTRKARYITDFSLKFLEQNLDESRFFRSHRSYIVQLDVIDSIAPWGAGTYKLIVDRAADLDVPLARSRAAELKSLIPWSASAFED